MQGYVKTFSHYETFILCALMASWMAYGAVNATMNCEQKLMEEIFVCVSRYNISLTKFLLAIGDINKGNNSTSNNITDLEGNKTDSSVTMDLINQNNGEENDNKDEDINDIPGSNTNDPLFPPSQNIDFDPSKNSKDASAIEENDILGEDFRLHACQSQPEVMECIFKSAKSLMDNPDCATSTGDSPSTGLLGGDQRRRVRLLMEAILVQYDVYCSHQCRSTLLDDMRSCYEEFDLDATLFMSHESHGAVLGSLSYDVENFCRNRVPLVKCLRSEKDNCPESDLVMAAVGLDLELMERGFELLCQHQYTYLRSLDCFESHTPEVGICHSVKHRRVISIASLAKLQNWTSDQYLMEVCRIRLDHIQCDLDAWSNKDDDNCDEHILDLKRQLHCALIPHQCLGLHQAKTDAICHPHNSNGSDSIVPNASFYSLLLCLIFSTVYKLKSIS